MKMDNSNYYIQKWLKKRGHFPPQRPVRIKQASDKADMKATN